MTESGPSEPDGLFFPVLCLGHVQEHRIQRLRVPVETPRGVRRSQWTVAIYADGEWFHLLPDERSLWISMQDGRLIGIVS